LADTVYDDRMSDADALTWTIERDPLLRSTILSVWLLDRMPDADRLHHKLEQTLQRIPRLRQRVVEDPLGVAPPRWRDDPRFHLPYHLRRLGVPGKGALRDLLDLAEPIAMQAFDRDRPLWELALVDGLEGGRAGVILKIHHAMSDGVGLVHMTSSLIERSAEAAPDADADADVERGSALAPHAADPRGPGPLDETLDALRYRAAHGVEQGLGAAGAVLRGLGRIVRGPVGAVRDAAELAASAARLLAPASEPLSPLMTGRSLGCCLHAFARPLPALRAAGKRVGGTVNDAFVAGVAGGLRHYHEAHGAPVDELRMTMPINLRHGQKGRRAGNQFAPVRFPVPVGIVDPLERMRVIRERVASERAEPSLPALDVLASALAGLPDAAATAAFGGMLKAVDFITSNVPGPTFPVYIAGARILEMIPFGPLSGSAANVVLFSYDGQAQIGVNSDLAAVPDAEVFCDCLEQGMDEVLATA
jgi:WS/DGAT/MGAT family acyltransferase